MTQNSWRVAIDSLENRLDAARDIPPWGIAVIVLTALSLLSMLIVCGFGCGVLVQQCSHQEYQIRRLLEMENVVGESEHPIDNTEAVDMVPVQKSANAKGKQRVSIGEYDADL